jgi:hypothetical protein
MGDVEPLDPLDPAEAGVAAGPPDAPQRIDDLDAPTFTPEVDEIRALLASMAPDRVPDPDALRARATAEVGLDDFGDRSYEAQLTVLVDALNDWSDLSAMGRTTMSAQLVGMLVNRLLLTDLLVRHPEIHDIEIVAPIVIAGLPRTGTTHLHNLMAADPALRSLPYWESLEPVPLPAERGIEPDPRLARTDQAVWFMDQALPLFPLMHEITTTHVHEEIQLLAIDFSTMYFETLAHVPAWRDHYLAHDQTGPYRYLKTVLQALQHLRGGRRWVLKSPQHIEQFGVLARVFPDATVVVTHRDPVNVVVSLATMITYSARLSAEPVRPEVFGRYWADRVETMLRACVRDRDLLPADQSIDVRFDEFMADDLAMVRRIYVRAGQPFDRGAEQATGEYLAGHRRGRQGRIDYQAEAVGLDPDELAQRFAFYVDRFW